MLTYAKRKRLANHGANEAAGRLLELYREAGGAGAWIRRRRLAPYELKVRARIEKNLGRRGAWLGHSLEHCLRLPMSYCTRAACGWRGIELW